MPTLEELETILIQRLYAWASRPNSRRAINGSEVVNMLRDLTGPAIGQAVFIQALRNGYLRQTRSISNESGGEYEITPALINAAGVPASDRIVTLDHNKPEYKNAVEAVANLQEALQRNNFYKENEPDDYAQREQELKALVSLLNAPRLSVSKIEAFGWGTLGYLATKFADEPIGELAKLAWQFLKALIS